MYDLVVKSSFNEARDAIAGMEWGKNGADEYAAALEGVSRRQREFILSTEDLSNKQIHSKSANQHLDGRR